MVETNLDARILVPVAVILVGGSILFWAPWFHGLEAEGYRWVLPWLFGAAVAGGYKGWLAANAAELIWIKIIYILLGCATGFVVGLFGLMSDPKMDLEPLEEYITTLALLGVLIGVVIGLHIRQVWRIPGPLLGGCVGPLIIGLLATVLFSWPQKVAAWLKARSSEGPGRDILVIDSESGDANDGQTEPKHQGQVQSV